MGVPLVSAEPSAFAVLISFVSQMSHNLFSVILIIDDCSGRILTLYLLHSRCEFHAFPYLTMLDACLFSQVWNNIRFNLLVLYFYLA